jgi:hypothetical protein
VDETTRLARFIPERISKGMSMSSLSRHLAIAAAAVALVSAGAAAQLLPSLGGPAVPLPTSNLPVAGPVLRDVLGGPGGPGGSATSAISPTLDTLGVSPAIAQLDPATLLDLRRARLRELVRQHRSELEMDGEGAPVRRGVLIAIDPDPAALAAALRAGFRLMDDSRSDSLGLRMVVLAAPRKMNVREAFKRLRAAAPSIHADYDHIFEPAGGHLAPAASALIAAPGDVRGARIAMVDGGVASHPSLAGASIEQRGFAGAAKPTGHGTAVASLIVGNQGPFRGAARGASLLVADVYGGSRAAGSASAIVRALDWVASRRPQVANISLVGPPNRLMARAVGALQARGISVVGAVGNDGPSAPPQYPASYPNVVSVTAVDAKGRALVEAGRAAHLDFAAPGADLAAALPGKGYARVRGTSFAAPLVSARLAAVGSVALLASEAEPGKGRIGRGIVCRSCRIDPRAVGAK